MRAAPTAKTNEQEWLVLVRELLVDQVQLLGDHGGLHGREVLRPHKDDVMNIVGNTVAHHRVGRQDRIRSGEILDANVHDLLWRLTASHKLFWVVLRSCWARWKEPLIQVTPRTVVGWHRAGFRLYWKWLSRAKSRGGRKPVSKQIRALIFQMVAENPTWGAPRIHGELLKLGFDLSEPTVSR